MARNGESRQLGSPGRQQALPGEAGQLPQPTPKGVVFLSFFLSFLFFLSVWRGEPPLLRAPKEDSKGVAWRRAGHISGLMKRLCPNTSCPL